MQTIRVNGQVIPPEAIQFEMERLMRFHAEHGMSQEQIRAQLPALARRAAEQAIGARLLLDEATRRQVEVEERDVDEQIEKLVEQLGGREAFVAALAEQQTDEALFREQVRQGRRVDKLIAAEVAGVAEPDETAIRQHFDDHAQEYRAAERVLAQHILIAPDGDTQTSRDEALATLLAIRARLLAGRSFEDEAAARSMCPSGQQGGSLGWFARGMMVPAFDEAVFALAVGATSDVIETQFGYHLIRKTAHEEAREATFEEAREQIRDFLGHARRGEALTAYVETLKAQAVIEVLDAQGEAS